jgi:S1-C subfamily serine protease
VEVVGGIDRVLGSDVARPIHGILQTDTVTNPDDSGSPLLDRTGSVIGINTAVQIGPMSRAAESTSRRIGFALPINTLLRLLPMLVEKQVLRPNLLGIAATGANDLLAKRLDLPVGSGIYVSSVILDSPAQRAGLIPAGFGGRGSSAGGDVIVAVDGVPVGSAAGFFAELDRHSPGDESALSVVRDRADIEVPANGLWTVGCHHALSCPSFLVLISRSYFRTPP